MYLMDSIQLYLLMVRQDQEKLSQCLDLIGTTMLVSKIQWEFKDNFMEVISFFKIRQSLVLFHDQ
jgi:hypothetical protein